MQLRDQLVSSSVQLKRLHDALEEADNLRSKVGMHLSWFCFGGTPGNFCSWRSWPQMEQEQQQLDNDIEEYQEQVCTACW